MNINDLIKVAIDKDYVLTKFLDEHESSKLYNTKEKDLSIYMFGGFDGAERTRAIIQNKDYSNPTNDDFEIALLKVSLPKDSKVQHRNVLGTLMSLGIKREVVGDILIDDNFIYIYITKEMVNFIKTNLTSINHFNITVEECDLNNLNIKSNTKQIEVNVSSLRIDLIISKVCNINRQMSKELVEKGKVFVNHIECLNSSYTLKENDLLSVRGFGRIKYIGKIRTTKKEKLVILLEIGK